MISLVIAAAIGQCTVVPCSPSACLVASACTCNNEASADSFGLPGTAWGVRWTTGNSGSNFDDASQSDDYYNLDGAYGTSSSRVCGMAATAGSNVGGTVGRYWNALIVGGGGNCPYDIAVVQYDVTFTPAIANGDNASVVWPEMSRLATSMTVDSVALPPDPGSCEGIWGSNWCYNGVFPWGTWNDETRGNGCATTDPVRAFYCPTAASCSAFTAWTWYNGVNSLGKYVTAGAARQIREGRYRGLVFLVRG